MLDSTIKLQLDVNSFQQVVDALWIINPTVREKYSDKDHLLGFMKTMADTYFCDGQTHSFSTAGFELTGYTIQRRVGETQPFTIIGIRASLSAYGVCAFLKRLNQQADALKGIVTGTDGPAY